ncbi:molybdate periplasmic binding protein [Hydrogenivirga sp. 128-5-R1-1]|nr:molybdate periplasmic binding protein [Hydrogenivirga sp. 128-5-R1-1]
MRALLLVLLLVVAAYSQTIYVASASSMRPLMEEVTEVFEKGSGVELKVSYGSSGNLFRQILGGAPYDVFISANEMYPERLLELGRAYHPTLFARGRLVIFTLKPELKGIEGLRSARRIAVANPRHAPYGRAAVEFLKKEGLYEELRTRLVFGSNVAQAFQFVVSGGADVGIVSLSLALTYPEGHYTILPEDRYPPIRHVAVLTERGRKKEVVLKFLEFLKSPEFKSMLEKFGFGAP